MIGDGMKALDAMMTNKPQKVGPLTTIRAIDPMALDPDRDWTARPRSRATTRAMDPDEAAAEACGDPFPSRVPGRADRMLWSFKCSAIQRADGMYEVTLVGAESGAIRKRVGYHPMWELIRLLAQEGE